MFTTESFFSVKSCITFFACRTCGSKYSVVPRSLTGPSQSECIVLRSSLRENVFQFRKRSQLNVGNFYCEKIQVIRQSSAILNLSLQMYFLQFSLKEKLQMAIIQGPSIGQTRDRRADSLQSETRVICMRFKHLTGDIKLSLITSRNILTYDKYDNSFKFQIWLLNIIPSIGLWDCRLENQQFVHRCLCICTRQNPQSFFHDRPVNLSLKPQANTSDN
jgi:hypothetical protein